MSGVVAIIPARGGSQSIKRKNLSLIVDETLVARTIRQSKAAGTIDTIIVSSEDEEIRSIATRDGVIAMDRPKEYHHDNSIQEVDRLLRWTILEYEKQAAQCAVIVLLYPTAPLRTVANIDACVRRVTEESYDSALSLFRDHSYLWRVSGDVVEPTNYVPELRGPRQIEDWNQLAENKAVYAMRRDLLVDTGCRLGGRIGWIEMSRLQSIDIDSEDELTLARILAARRDER